MYNAFWDEFEKGMTVAELDRIFPRRREGLVDLLNQIRSSKVNIRSTRMFFGHKRQENFSLFMLDVMGYDYKNSGRVDETEHPFTTSLGPGDTRITTHYFEEDIESALFSTIHERG